MLDMAQNFGQGVTKLGQIAQHQGISQKYLEQIIIPLKKAQYVKSVRGGKGGHMLAKPPQEITVGEIVALLEGGPDLIDCAENPGICDRSGDCMTRTIWQEAAAAMFEKLNAVTLADLLKNHCTMEEIAPPDQCPSKTK